MRRWWTVACAIGLGLAGCLPEEATDPKPGQGSRADAHVADAHAAAAAPADAGADAAAADAGADAAPMSGPCVYPADCPGGDCVDGMCFYGAPAQCPDNDNSLCPEGETCGGFITNYYCISPCEADQSCPIRPRPCSTHINCPFGSVCQDGRCINACETDLDCGADGYCIDGQCLPYPTDILNGDPPQAFGTAGQLYAGVGWVHLDYPVGVSLAGYGARPGPHTPYSVALGGSDRFFEGQDVRVIALSSDKDMVILIRIPLSWSTDYLLTLIAQKLQVLTKSPEHPNGINYHSKLVIGGTHSHSQVARFWYLLPTTGFAVAGYDYFSKELANRYAQSFADAAFQALQNMKPAKFGYRIVDDFDPQGRIHSDRRDSNPPFKDDRMLVWRVDDMATGQPMAGMVNFAMHGTHMMYPWVTGDAPAGVEVIATDKVSTEYGHPIPVMFINGNAGDVSPRGDNAVAQDWGMIQAVGYRVWPIFRDAFDHIETRPDADIEIVTHRIPLSYSIVGYDRSRGEFKSKRFARPHYWGGFQCAVGEKNWMEEGYHDGDLDCRINLETYLHAPVPQFAKTTLTAFRIGDLVVTTLPGEPVSQLGRDLSAAVEQAGAAHGVTVHSVNFGYSQDHQLYLTPAEDWLHGGYEASMSVWGWKNGDHLKDESVKLATELFTPEKEDDDTGVKPTWFPGLEDDAVPPTPTPGDAEGTVKVQPPAEATRGDLVEVTWTGGHPGVDLPVVHLERQDGGNWAPALRTGGHVWDNWGFETLTIYKGDFQADHSWSVSWELAFDLPEGDYRFVAEGHAVGTDGQTHAYTATTSAFTLHAATLQLREAGVSDGMLHVKVNYPNGPSTDDGHSAFAALDSTGHWLRFDADRDLGGDTRKYAMLLGGPVEGPVHVAVDGADASEADPTAVADTVALDLVISRDAQGQTTTTHIPDWSTARLDLPAPATPGDYTVTVTDAAGNRGTAVVTVP